MFKKNIYLIFYQYFFAFPSTKPNVVCVCVFIYRRVIISSPTEVEKPLNEQITIIRLLFSTSIIDTIFSDFMELCSFLSLLL